MADSVPLLGLYMPQNNAYKIQIENANPSTGTINGLYEPQESPQPFPSQPGVIGHYAWVTNAQGQNGVPPFSINFYVSVRPAGWPYCLTDTWNGAYQAGNSMLLAGTRAYVNNQGVVQVTSLGTLTFLWVQ